MNTRNNLRNSSYIPLHPNSKRPIEPGWQRHGLSLHALARYGTVPTDINLGVLTGKASGDLVDADFDGSYTIEAARILMTHTGMVTGRDSRRDSHWWYRIKGDTKTVKFQHPSTNAMLVELRGDGCQTMVPPSNHPDGEPVHFEPGKDGEPALIDREVLLRQLGCVAVVSILAPYWIKGGRHTLALLFAGLCACNVISREDCARVVQAIATITGDDETDDRLRTIETTYSRVAEGQAVEWRSALTKLLGSDKAIRTLIEWMGGRRENISDSPATSPSSNDRQKVSRLSPKLDTDVEIADWFKVSVADRLIYADHQKQFYKKVHGVYDPVISAEMKGMITDFLSGPVCSSPGSIPENRRMLQSLTKINSTFEISKSLLLTDDRLFDKDDHLLGTENGVFDLSTFKIVDTNEVVTRRIGTKYVPYADCPAFERFLEQVFEGDEEKKRYLQRGLGYTLTGSVDAQIMIIFTGRGANGKSVLLKLISALMGTYGGAVPSHTITQQKFGNDKTDDLASLVGKRFVVASEGDVGDKLAMAKVKRLVAGDPISVRPLYGKYFDLQPKFKLFFGSNDLPQVSGTDYAIWRRIHVVEFTRVFEPHERDPKLLEKLKVELPGIFNWALEGLKAIGSMKGDFLDPPASVLQSVNDYRADNDNVSKFIEDKCVRDPSCFVSMGDLYNSYTSWCYDNAVEPMNNNMLGKELTNLGFSVVRKNTGNARKGLRLR